jgi:hypothetical protein
MRSRIERSIQSLLPYSRGLRHRTELVARAKPPDRPPCAASARSNAEDGGFRRASPRYVAAHE